MRRWDAQLGAAGWPKGSARPARGPGESGRGEASATVVEFVGRGLVEYELWYGLGLGGIVGWSLIQEKVSTMLRMVPGGPRAGEIGGGWWGNSRCDRMAAMPNSE